MDLWPPTVCPTTNRPVYPLSNNHGSGQTCSLSAKRFPPVSFHDCFVCVLLPFWVSLIVPSQQASLLCGDPLVQGPYQILELATPCWTVFKGTRPFAYEYMLLFPVSFQETNHHYWKYVVFPSGLKQMEGPPTSHRYCYRAYCRKQPRVSEAMQSNLWKGPSVDAEQACPPSNMCSWEYGEPGESFTWH